MRLLAPLALLLWAGAARAAGDPPAAAPDAALRQELSSADAANLGNAEDHARGDAATAARWVLALASTARQRAARLAEESHGAYAPDLAAFAEREGAFRKAAAAAGLKPPRTGDDDLLAAGSGYRAGDRREDLASEASFLKRAGERGPVVPLPPSDASVCGAAAALAGAASELSTGAAKLPAPLAEDAQALAAEAAGLGVEGRLLTDALSLDAVAAADFDKLPPKGEPEED